MKKLLAAAALAAAGTAHAFTFGPAYVYGDLNWTTAFNSSLFNATCNHIALDAMGDLSNSTRLMFFGSLNCGQLGYAMTGSGYFANDGTINITLIVGGSTISCPRLVNFGGFCGVYDAAGNQRGNALLTFR
jgi:hypothetical protein